MAARSPELALRRTVVELARAAPDDITAVLEQLPSPDRQRVEALLRSYAEATASAEWQTRNASGGDFARNLGLSSWFLALIDADSAPSGGSTDLFGPARGSARRPMTAVAREGLLAAIQEVHSQRDAAFLPQNVATPAWLGRLLGMRKGAA